MEFAEVVRRRRMVRAYADRPLPPGALDALLDAAVRAPSAGFTQGVSFLVLSEAADREQFWHLTGDRDTAWLRGMRRAPALVGVWTSERAYLDRYAEPDKGWTERDATRWSAPYWFVDAGMASLALLLAAVDAELGACFFGVPPDRVPALRSAYGVPSEQLCVGVVAVGYPASDPGPRGSAARRPRRPAHEIVHAGRWSAGPPAREG